MSTDDPAAVPNPPEAWSRESVQMPATAPAPSVAVPPQAWTHPLLRGYSGILPFPSHWNASLRQSAEMPFAQLRLDDAVRSATLLLEARLRALCGLPGERIGVDLVNQAFNPDGGFLSQASIHTAEREGLHALFRGAMQQIRNPVGHRDLNQLPGTAFDTLAFVNYLLDVAQEAALAKYVHPFLGKWGGPYLMVGISRCDMNGDGSDELVVVTCGPSAIRALILQGDGLLPMPGSPPIVPGTVAAAPIFYDLDGDGRMELVLAGGDRDASGHWHWRGLVVDCAADGTIRSFPGPPGDELMSDAIQFQVVRPMQIQGPAIAAMAGSGTYRFWTFDGTSLSEYKDVPDA